MQKRAAGSALTEYGLLGSAILVAAIGAILLFSEDLSMLMGGTRDDMKANIAATAQAARNNPFKDPPPVSPVVIGDPAAPGGGTAPSTAIDLNLLHKDLADKLQTAGANGTTRLLASTIESIAQQLYDAKEISQQQYDILMQLANKGHEMAEVERLLEKALADANGDADKFSSTKIAFQGKTYTADEMYRWVGTISANINSPELESMASVGNMNPGLKSGEFIALFEKAMNTGGMLDDPLVQSTLTSLSMQIVATGETFDGMIHDSLNNERDLPTGKNLNQELASEVTDYDSSEICKMGDYKDGGTMCSPKG